MNKAIAEVYGWIIGIVHVIMIALIVLFPVEYILGLTYFGYAWLTKAILVLLYVGVFGAVSVLVSINEHLRDISAKLGGTAIDGATGTQTGRRVDPT